MGKPRDINLDKTWIRLRQCVTNPHDLRDKLGQQLNLTFAWYNNLYGTEQRYSLVGRDIGTQGKPFKVKSRHFLELGVDGTMTFDKAEKIANACGTDLKKLVLHLWGYAPHPKNDHVRNSIRNWNVNEKFEDFAMPPTTLFLDLQTDMILEVLRQDGTAEAQALAREIQNAVHFTVTECRQRYPQVYTRVIAPHIGPHRQIIKSKNVLEEPAAATTLTKALQGARSEADSFCGWGALLPCSLVSEQFMRSHHKELFDRLTPGSQAMQDTYNEVGAANAANTLRALTESPSFSFFHVLEAETVRHIAHGLCDFKAVSDQDRASLHTKLQELHHAFPGRIHIFVVDKNHPGLLARLFPGIESTWFMLKNNVAMAAVERLPDGSLQIWPGGKRPREKYLTLTSALVNANRMDLHQFDKYVAELNARAA